VGRSISGAAQDPNPATVEALLGTTWRLVDAERARRDAIERKATALVSFASLVLSLTATLGARFLEIDEVWAVVVYLSSLCALALAVAIAIFVLLPRERMMLGMAYVHRFPTRSEVAKAPVTVQGETMRGLVETLGADRSMNQRSARWVFRAFVLLFLGLLLVSVEAAVVAVRSVV
jgi:hypothetical protein